MADSWFGGLGARSMVAATALVASAAGVALPAVAQAAVHRFDIPSGSLGGAVARLGQQAGVVIAVDAALVRGRRSAGLSATLTLPQALARLLDGTGLRAEADGRGGYRLVAAAAAPRASLGAARATPPVQRAPDPAAAPEPQEAEEPIVVVGALTDVEITADQIELAQANDLTDLFRDVPSVTVGGSVGIAQKIYVRGLEDSMLNVTVDGAPQRGTLFHHIGRVGIEPELLKTVDVQAGAGEATSGFGAIGGAIRFRTKDASDLLGEGRDFGGIAKAGYFTNEGYKLSGTVFARIAGDVGVLGSYVYTDRGTTRDGAGNDLLGTDATQQLGFIKVGGAIGGGHRLSVSYEHRDEQASFAQRPNWPVLAGNPLFEADATRQTAILNYGYDSDDGIDIEATGYWTRSEFTQDRTDRWGLYGAEVASYGFDLRGRRVSGNHDLVFGAEYRRDEVMSQYLSDPAQWQRWAWDPSVGRFEETGSVLGFYLQDHWKPVPQLTVSAGVRYDGYDMDQVTYRNATDSEGVSFNAGLRYELVPGLALNASFAEAFRGKEIGDGFTLEKRPGRIAFPTDLRAETVDNYEVGASFDRDGFRASAVYYSMTIDDVILDQIGNGPAPQASVYYENVGRFRAEGVELRAGFARGPFSIDGYFNHYRSKLNGELVEGYEHIGLANSVGDNWNLTAGWTPSPTFGLEASVTHYADLNDIEVLHRNVAIGWIDSTRFVDKPGYTTLDIFGRWQPLGDDRLTLLAAVTNLLDTRYRAHASVADYSAIPGYEGVVGVNEPGRNIRLTAAIRF